MLHRVFLWVVVAVAVVVAALVAHEGEGQTVSYAHVGPHTGGEYFLEPLNSVTLDISLDTSSS